MERASIVASHLRPRINKPAGMVPPAHRPEAKMIPHLLLLLLIVVIVGLEVKVVISRKR
jgi:hypothetical protein